MRGAYKRAGLSGGMLVMCWVSEGGEELTEPPDRGCVGSGHSG